MPCPKNWLRVTDAHQNDDGLLYEFSFGILNIRKGQRHILIWEDFERLRDSRIKLPQAPAIQLQLKQALLWAERLKGAPGLTRAALAREAGIDPTRLSQIMNLLNLAPTIRSHILTLHPSIGRGPVSERQLRELSRVQDRQAQVHEFDQLLTTP